METVEKEFFRTKFKKQNAELVISTEGFIPSNMEEQYEKEMTEWLKKLKDFETDEELASILTESDRRYTWKYIDDFDEELNPFLLATAKMIGKKVVYTNKRKGIHFSLDHNWNFQGTMNKPETGELILAYHEFSAKDLNEKQKENYISFNFDLIEKDIECIEYVVLHELCHIFYMNHQKDFWALVEKYMPDYKVRRKKLKTFI